MNVKVIYYIETWTVWEGVWRSDVSSVQLYCTMGSNYFWRSYSDSPINVISINAISTTTIFLKSQNPIWTVELW